jgi:outer membrane protein OmpA-like peptidoglycan-associated protein
MNAVRTLVLIAGFALIFLGVTRQTTAGAEEGQLKTPSMEEIKKALKKERKTRGLKKSDTDDATIDALVKKRKTRGLNQKERDELYTLTANKPQVDLPIYFEYGSATITPEAKTTLDQLGQVLSSEEHAKEQFIVAGHTDAHGSAEYNQLLSEQRAAAVKAYLGTQYQIPSDVMTPVGYGAEQLRNAADPFAAENRRVQIVTHGQ